MQTVSRASLITGRIITTLVGLFMLVDGMGHALRLGPYLTGTVQLGFSESFVTPLGILGLVCAVLYLIPRTAVLGSILLTGYFGGAIVTGIRAHQPFWFALLFGMLAWLGIYLRDARVRALIPLRATE